MPLAEERRDAGWTAPALIVVALLAIGWPALDAYNVTWDEALGDFFFGERYLSFFTSLDRRYLDFQADPYPEERRPDLGLSPFRGRPWEYYPLANTLAAATSAVTSRWLGLLDPFDGFHAVNLLLAAVFVVVFHRYLARRFGGLAATAASVLLLTLPRVFSHLMANIKDFPLLVIYSLAALAFASAWERGTVRGSGRGLLGAGALWGGALATKANALFFPLLPLLVLLGGGMPTAWRGRGRRLLLTGLAAGALGLAVMIALWPYLWADPIGRGLENLRYIAGRKAFTAPGSVAPVFQAILLTTPPAFLALVGIGVWPCWKAARRKEPAAVLLLAWPVAVLARYALPQAVNFDGVRHFLELFPALAAIAGLGVATLARGAERWWRRLANGDAPGWLAPAVLTAALLPGAWATLAAHPFQIAYWNTFAGGHGGARAAGLAQAGDYWGTSYRIGLRWLNEHAPENALLAVPVVEHAVRLVASERLREDILLLPVTTPYSPRIAPERLEKTREAAARRPLLVMFVPRRDWMNELMRDCLEHLEPVAEWQLDGAPVLLLYRYR